jgi:hypothetical protein
VAAHFDQAVEVVVPGLGAAARRQGPHPHVALLDAVALPDVAFIGVVRGRTLEGLLAHGLVQLGLVGLELAQHVAASGQDLLNCFFDSAVRPS